MEKFLVGTGMVLFHIDADSPRHAIELLKREIRAREHVRRHPTIGMSLVDALKAGTLNFIVFDAERTKVLAGELNGEFVQPTRRLADAFRRFIPADVYYRLPFLGATDIAL